jgi:hypothetical protein
MVRSQPDLGVELEDTSLWVMAVDIGPEGKGCSEPGGPGPSRAG